MPISSDQFEAMQGTRGGETTPGPNESKILSFLREHADMAFTQSEIADETDVKPESVGPTLIRLRERGQVEVGGDYWGVSDHEQSVAAATGQAETTIAVREAAEERSWMNTWREHAVDPREHREE